MAEIRNCILAGKILMFVCAKKEKKSVVFWKVIYFSSFASFFWKFRYCTDTKTIFTTSVTLKNHISLMHGIKNPDLSQMPKMLSQDSKKAPRKVYY